MATKQYKLVHIGNESYAIEKKDIIGDYWMYIGNGQPLEKPTKNILGQLWFDQLHDKEYYYTVIAATDPSLNLPLIDKSILVQSESLSYIQSITPKPVAIEVEMEEKDKQVQFEDGSWDRSYITTSEPIIENNYIKCKAIWE
jgi:hypothetical protein